MKLEQHPMIWIKRESRKNMGNAGGIWNKHYATLHYWLILNHMKILFSLISEKHERQKEKKKRFSMWTLWNYKFSSVKNERTIISINDKDQRDQFNDKRKEVFRCYFVSSHFNDLWDVRFFESISSIFTSYIWSTKNYSHVTWFYDFDVSIKTKSKFSLLFMTSFVFECAENLMEFCG